VSGQIVSYKNVGTCTLQATKEGDALYYSIAKTINITVYAPARLSVAPRINQVGRVAYGKSGTWLGTPTPSFKYQWYSCTTASRTKCTALSGATSVNLTVTSKIVGKYAFLRVFMYQGGQERARTDSNVIKLSAR
jgi:hypothetical protein